jgi:hypothetical protein
MFVCCKACDEMGKACSKCLCPVDRPSPIFTIWSGVLSAVGGLLILLGLTDSDAGKQCDGTKLKTWLIVSLILFIVNFLFSIYIYIRFAHKVKQGESAGNAAHKLFLYDIGVYFMIWTAIFEVIWTILGTNWKSDESSDCKAWPSAVSSASLVLWLYIGGSIFVIGLSLVTECCRSPGWANGREPVQGRPVAENQYHNHPPAPQAAYNPYANAAPPQHQPQQMYPPQAAYGGPPPAQNPQYMTSQGQHYQQQPQYQQQQQQPQQSTAGRVAAALKRNIF